MFRKSFQYSKEISVNSGNSLQAVSSWPNSHSITYVACSLEIVTASAISDVFSRRSLIISGELSRCGSLLRNATCTTKLEPQTQLSTTKMKQSSQKINHLIVDVGCRQTLQKGHKDLKFDLPAQHRSCETAPSISYSNYSSTDSGNNKINLQQFHVSSKT